jgi:phosphodiesterase/alkaline phosphatase D-like protein
MIDTRSRRDDPGDGTAMQDPNHSELGPDQASWLFHALRASRARWRLLGNGSCMTHLWSDRLPAASKEGVLALKLTNPDFTGPDPDQWDGYPAERDRIFQALEDGGRGTAVAWTPNGSAPSAGSATR